MYASTIGDILVKFAYRFQPRSSIEVEGDGGKDDDVDRDTRDNEKSTKTTAIKSLSILGDVTYGACCIDDLSARALGCDLLVHYGHSCLVPLTCTVIPCLYVFVEIRVDVQHLVDCVRMTFLEEERVRLFEGERKVYSTTAETTRIIETLVMGTVQFRSAVVEAAQRLNEVTSSTSSDDSTNIRQVQFQAIVPQAKPLSPGEVLGCTAPSGLAQMDFEKAMSASRRRQARRSQDATDDIDEPASNVEIAKERVMIFLADGRFHLEAAMISNPSLRALRYDPYSKTLTEERYEIVKMKRIRRDAIQSARKVLGISSTEGYPTHINATVGAQVGDAIADSVLQCQPSQTSSGSSSQSSPLPKTMGIILGTLGRQGNPAILSRVRSLLHSRGIRSIIVLLSEIFPKKLEMLSSTNPDRGGRVCSWVQIACPRLSIDWGHYFCVPVLSPFELFVAFGEVVDSTLWNASDDNVVQNESNDSDEGGYPMDFYSKGGGPWTNYYESNKARKAVSYGV